MPRLTRLYTRGGDTGATGLVGGRRVSKDHPRIVAVGAVDELNAALGLVRAFNHDEPSPAAKRLETVLARVQNDLFNLGARLATPAEKYVRGMPTVSRARVRALERLIDRLNAALGPLPEFILPAGSKTAAALHVARTVCRRAERACVRLAGAEAVGSETLPYLNRLGDALFVLARWANRDRGIVETYWRK